jgi:hypothetical protein
MIDPVNYGALTQPVLIVGAQVACRHALKRSPLDAFAIKACIDAIDKELAKLEAMAAGYCQEFSATK